MLWRILILYLLTGAMVFTFLGEINRPVSNLLTHVDNRSRFLVICLFLWFIPLGFHLGSELAYSYREKKVLRFKRRRGVCR